MATEPSKVLTAARKDSCGSSPLISFRATKTGIALASVVISGEKAKFPDGHEEEHKIVKTSPPKDPEQVKNLVQWILAQ